MRDRSTKMLAVLMVSLMAVVALAPLAGEETDAATTTYSSYGIGLNTSGQLGNGTTTNSNTLVQLGSNLGNIVDVAVTGSDSGLTTYILTDTGELYGAGYNANGELGQGTTSNSSTLVQIGSNLGDIVSFKADKFNLVFETSNGKLYYCGANGYSQAGKNSTSAILEPVEIASNVGTIEDYFVAGDGILVVNENNELYFAGRNSGGRSGNGGTDDVTTFTRIASSLTVGKVVFTNTNTLIITSNGDLYAAGLNQTNMLSPSGSSFTSFGKINTTQGSVDDAWCIPNDALYFKTTDGKLYAQGNNTNGELGQGSTNAVSGIVEISLPASKTVENVKTWSSYTAVFFMNDGTAYYLGQNNQNTFGSSIRATTLTQVYSDLSIKDLILPSFSSTYCNCLIQTTDGKLYGMGRNDNASMGAYDTTLGYNVVYDGPAEVKKAANGYNTTVFTTSTTVYDVEFLVNDDDYGTVSTGSVSVTAGTTITASTNTISLGTSPDATVITATSTAADAQYTYAFDSWTGVPAGGTVTEDLTITANFTRTLNEYTITWVIGESSETTTVAYGSTPTHADPTPPDGYYFVGWDPEIVPVTAAATYTAVFSNMTVTFDAGKGTLSGPTTMNVVQGQPIGDLPTPTPKAGYTFTGWFDSEGNEVTSETIVTETESFTLYAQYELDDSLKPVKAMTDLLPLIFVVGIIILMIGTAFYYYRP